MRLFKSKTTTPDQSSLDQHPDQSQLQRRSGAPSLRWSRRRFLTSVGALVVAPTGAFLYAVEVEPHWLQIAEHDLPIANLPAALVGKTLMQLSDLHISVVDGEYLAQSFEAARARKPDLVVVTGDWVSYRGDRSIDELAMRIPGLPKGRLGTFGILGNHDYGHDWQMPKVAEKIQRILEDSGVRILRNEASNAHGLRLIGLDDLWGPYFQPQDVLRRHGEEPATIVLCHNPDAMDHDVWHGFRGWTLAGHTHGGQCKPPFLPPPILPVQNRRYTSGVIEIEHGRRLYINRGVGYLKRVRFNVRPEITLFALRRAEIPSAESPRRAG